MVHDTFVIDIPVIVLQHEKLAQQGFELSCVALRLENSQDSTQRGPNKDLNGMTQKKMRKIRMLIAQCVQSRWDCRNCAYQRTDPVTGLRGNTKGTHVRRRH